MGNMKFSYNTAAELLSESSNFGIDLPYSEQTGILASPLAFGKKTIPNRLLAQPIEGFDANPDGSPSQRTADRYCELARGGSGALWIESVSVNYQGRSNPAQLWIRPENWDSFRDMVRAIRQAAHGPIYLILQLTHSGRNSNPDGIPTPICSFHSEAIPKENEHIISDDEVRALEADYVEASRLAWMAGFDAVDIRACHGYLINEFFAAVHRPGEYGGSFENRVRLLLNIVDQVRETVDIDVAVRLNMYDGIPYPYGWGVDPQDSHKMDLTEPLKLVSLLYQRGIRLLNISSGVGAYSPFVIRPYDTGGVEPWEHPLCGIGRMQRCARLVKELAPDAVVVASAFSWLREFAPNVAAGGIQEGWYDIAGFGRESIAYPQYANDIIQKGFLNRKNCCVTCCGCTNLIKKSGKMLRCIMKDKLNNQE